MSQLGPPSNTYQQPLLKADDVSRTAPSSSSSSSSASSSSSSTSSSSSSSKSSSQSSSLNSHDMAFWVDFSLVCAVLFSAESARGIVIPILSNFVDSLGGSSFFLSVVVSAFSVGRLIASFLFGMVSERMSTKWQLLIAMIICVFGNGVFIIADALSSSWLGKWVLLGSRILTGFGTGVLTVARSHVAATTTTNERTIFMSWLGIVQFVGFSFTPSVGGLSVYLAVGALTVTTNTFGSYILLFIDIVLCILITFFMRNVHPSQQQQKDKEKEKEAAQPPASSSAAIKETDDASSTYRITVDSHASTTESSVTKKGAPSTTPSTSAAVAVQQPAQQPTQDDNPVGHDEPTIRALAKTPLFGSEYMQFHDDKPDVEMDEHNDDDEEEAEVEERKQDDEDPTVAPTTAADDIDDDYSKHTNNNNIQNGSVNNTSSAAPVASFSSTSFVRLNPSYSVLSESRMGCVPLNLAVPFLYVFLNLSCRGTLGVAETYAANLYYSVSETRNSTAAGLFITAFGAVGVLFFLLIPRIARWIKSEITLLVFGFVCITFGFLCIISYGEGSSDTSSNNGASLDTILKREFFIRYLIGNVAIWSLGAAFCQTLTVSLMSKFLGKRPQGKWMGLITAGGSIGRIVFPVVAGALDTMVGLDGAFAFCAAISITSLLSIGLILGVYQRNAMLGLSRSYKKIRLSISTTRPNLTSSSNIQSSAAEQQSCNKPDPHRQPLLSLNGQKY